MIIAIWVVVGVLGIPAFFSVGWWWGLRQFEHRMQVQVVQLNHALASTKAAQALMPHVRCHTVLLDGVSHGGKTTFMARLACPTADAQQLLNVATTRRQALTQEIPLCWERTDDGGTPPVLHALRFFDVSGEKPSTVINAIRELTQRANDEERVVALWVWDLSSLPANRSRMTREVVNALYDNEEARALIKKIVVFFNKVDFLLATMDPQTVEKLVSREEAYIRDVLDKALGSGYELQFQVGSAMDGRGMLEVFGSLLRSLELGKNYQAPHVVEPQVALLPPPPPPPRAGPPPLPPLPRPPLVVVSS